MSECPFCNTPSKSWAGSEDRRMNGFQCVICGVFYISDSLYAFLENRPIDSQKLNCISENIKVNDSDRHSHNVISWHLQKEQNPSSPNHSILKRYEDFAFAPIVHANKSNDLLAVVAKKASKVLPFDAITLSKKDIFEIKILDIHELIKWTNHLESNGEIRFIRGIDFGSGIDQLKFEMTPKGWQSFFQNQKSINSLKVFIAMQFDWKNALDKRDEFIAAVKLACKDCGYEAALVNEKHHIDQITDRIISEIKSSKFVVADFTFNNRGVYYEAGYAKGLGIPVIHTVMKGHSTDHNDQSKKLHFDIRQINYIEWESAETLREQLKDRIKAVIE